MNLQEAIKHLDDILSDKNKSWECKKCRDEHEQLQAFLKELQEYRLAEENGTLIKLPCKVGDTVYVFYERFVDGKIQILEKTIAWVEVYSNQLVISVDGAQYAQSEFNKTFFLTREEAEKALKERESE